MNKRFKELLDKYFADSLDEQEFREFESLLEGDEELRKAYLEQTLLDIRFLNPDQPKRLMARLRRDRRLWALLEEYE